MQVVGGLVRRQAEQLYLPAGIRCLVVHGQPGLRLFCEARLRNDDDQGAGSLSADVVVYDDSGELVAEVTGLQFQPFGSPPLAPTADEFMYEVQWVQQRLPESRALHSRPGRWLIFADEQGTSQRLAELLKTRGDSCQLVYPRAAECHQCSRFAGAMEIDPA